MPKRANKMQGKQEPPRVVYNLPGASISLELNDSALQITAGTGIELVQLVRSLSLAPTVSKVLGLKPKGGDKGG